MLESKNAMVRRLVANEEYKKALSICKDWRVGIRKEDTEALRLGYECLVHPRLYEQMGEDTQLRYLEAVEVLKRLYGS